MKTPFPFPNQGRVSETGSVLIVVLWVSLGLVALTLVFAHSMLMSYRAADNDLAGYQADAAIDAGLSYAETVLSNTGTPGLFPDITTYQGEAIPVGDASFWFIGRDNNNTPTTTPVFCLVDEASKINLNNATEAMLEALPGMTPDLADAIIDWRTAPGSATTTTAGGSYNYESLQPPYTDKNATFESVEELSLVYGMDNITLYGEDANLNGALDPNEDDGEKTQPSDNANGTLDPGLLEYVTVYSREPNTKSDGTAKVSVATVSPLPQPVIDLLTTTFGAAQSTTFQTNLTASGATPVGSLMEFYIRTQMTADQFAQIADSITVSTGQYVTGLINVNTASETVLGCIPGIGLNNAPAIISARQSRTTGDTSFVWVRDILGDAAATQAGKYITGKSYQVSADIAAVGRNNRGYRRTRFIIDTTDSTAPKVIYRRSLSQLGWALGRDTRQTLDSRNNGI